MKKLFVTLEEKNKLWWRVKHLVDGRIEYFNNEEAARSYALTYGEDTPLALYGPQYTND